MGSAPPPPPNNTHPQFFKVYQPHQSSQSLMIPPAFEDKISGKIQNRVFLRNGLGKIWLVKVVKIEEGLCFEGGWSKFVSKNLLEPGDFLVFKYLRQRIFDVLILGKNGCEKELVATEEADEQLNDHRRRCQTQGLKVSPNIHSDSLIPRALSSGT